jgi:hypothetical protein
LEQHIFSPAIAFQLLLEVHMPSLLPKKYMLVFVAHGKPALKVETFLIMYSFIQDAFG